MTPIHERPHRHLRVPPHGVPRRRAATAGGVIAVALLLAACGGAGQAVDDIVDQAASAPACSAVSGVQEQLAGVDVAQIPPDQLSQLQTGAAFVSTAVGALSDRVPAEVGEQLDDTRSRLDAAVDGAEGDAQERQSAIEDAIAGYAAQLDDVAARLGC